ncbi:MAG TPA: DUF5666 domain-containing protein [Pyrinomonadaceae bacterium]|nr:DUF5666 domain-containing protein [Pyrinomonadaceae bacterium]
MLKSTFSFLFGIIVIGSMTIVYGQGTDTVKPRMISGDVVAVDASSINVKTAAGEISATISEKTEFKKAAADDPKKMTPSTLADISVGDKLLVSGFPSADGKTVPAIRVYLMSKSDIAQKNAKEAAEWRTRGISGTISAINAQTNQVTIDVPGMMASTKTVMTPKADATFRRYSTESFKFSDAKVGTFADLAVGDSIRAKGDRSADGTSFTAEEILTGAFQQVVGVVKTIDAANNEVVITDRISKKDITVSFASASTMKRFPPEFAERLAGGQTAQGGPGGAAPGAGGPPAGGQPAGQGGQRPGGMGGMGGGPRGGIDEMLERFPTIGAADLKVGDMIAVSSSKTKPEEKIRAIKLLAGVEPFVRIAEMRAAMGAAQGGGRNAQPGLNIPGLDGFSMQ